MAQGLHCRVRMYLSGSDLNLIREETCVLLSDLFKSLEINSVAYRNNTISVGDAVKHISQQLTAPRSETNDIIDLLNQIKDQHLTMEVGRWGTSFGACFKPKDPIKSSGTWEIYWRPGVFPILELKTFYGQEFQPKAEWASNLVSKNQKYFISVDPSILFGRECFYGPGYNRFLWWKYTKLGLAFKTNVDVSGVQTGVRLRQLCQEIWNKRNARLTEMESVKLWSWRKRFLMSEFDKALIEEITIDGLAEILKHVGITADQWLQNIELPQSGQT